jgi:hypothetical protein
VVRLSPIRSVVPSSVRHTVVNSLEALCRLIPIKRVPSRLRNLAVAWSGEEEGNMSRQPEKPSKVKAKHGLHRKTRRKRMGLENRPVLEPNAAGIDIGAREIFVAVPPGPNAHPVQVFDTFTEDLHRLANWLQACGVTTVAMESTGVYWIPLYDILEERGLRPCLVNARHMKNVPGRRTDWHECQWLQYLHSGGFTARGFPTESRRLCDACSGAPPG